MQISAGYRHVYTRRPPRAVIILPVLRHRVFVLLRRGRQCDGIIFCLCRHIIVPVDPVLRCRYGNQIRRKCIFLPVDDAALSEHHVNTQFQILKLCNPVSVCHCRLSSFCQVWRMCIICKCRRISVPFSGSKINSIGVPEIRVQLFQLLRRLENSPALSEGSDLIDAEGKARPAFHGNTERPAPALIHIRVCKNPFCRRQYAHQKHC